MNISKAEVVKAIEAVRAGYRETDDRPMRGSGLGHLTPAQAVGQLPHDFADRLAAALSEGTSK